MSACLCSCVWGVGMYVCVGAGICVGVGVCVCVCMHVWFPSCFLNLGLNILCILGGVVFLFWLALSF